ncbi:hypothetical protein PPHE_a1493 [Pseudoalteromonas phenolica O-BC30]|nr:hypothetical protein [Pseudoalteromonas phenolica O-BC30]
MSLLTVLYGAFSNQPAVVVSSKYFNRWLEQIMLEAGLFF